MGQAKQEGRQAHLGGGQRTHICLERGRQALQMSSPKQGFAARTCLPWQRNGTQRRRSARGSVSAGQRANARGQQVRRAVRTRGASAAEEFLQVENVKIHCAWL